MTWSEVYICFFTASVFSILHAGTVSVGAQTKITQACKDKISTCSWTQHSVLAYSQEHKKCVCVNCTKFVMFVHLDTCNCAKEYFWSTFACYSALWLAVWKLCVWDLSYLQKFALENCCLHHANMETYHPAFLRKCPQKTKELWLFLSQNESENTTTARHFVFAHTLWFWCVKQRKRWLVDLSAVENCFWKK